MLHQVNSYIDSFKYALERMPSDKRRCVIRADKTPGGGEHESRFYAPETNGVAVVIAGDECCKRDIVLHKRNHQLQRVAETHRSYDALQYPMLFCQGQDDYNFLIKQTNPLNGQYIEGKKVSSMEFTPSI